MENGAHFSGEGHLIEGEIEGHPNKEVRSIVCDADGHLIIDLDASTITIGTVEIEGPSGNRAQVDAEGDLQVDVNNFPANQNVTVTNGAGAAAVNIQDGGNSITVDGPLTDAQLRASPVPVSGSFSPSGTQDVNIVSTIPIPVTDNGGSLTVDGTVAVSNFPATQPVSGTVTVTQATGTNLHTVVDNFPVTQPVSGTVAATQSGEWDVNIEDTAGNALTSTGNALDVNIKSTGVTQPVSGSVSVSNFPVTQNVNITGNTTDFATQTTLAEVEEDLDQFTFSATRLIVDGSQVTQPVSGTLTTSQITSSTATLTNVSGSASSVTLLSANASRKQAMIWNDSTATLSVKFGTTASATSFTVNLVAQAYYELPEPVYTGRIDGIWTVAVGTARITELT